LNSGRMHDRMKQEPYHIGGPSSNQAASLESQPIHSIQLLFGRTLRILKDALVKSVRWACKRFVATKIVLRRGIQEADMGLRDIFNGMPTY